MYAGKVIPFDDVVTRNDAGECFNEDEDPMQCCEWVISRVGYFSTGLIWCTCLWADAVICQIRNFTVAGSITQWYAHPRAIITQSSLRPAWKLCDVASIYQIVFACIIA